MHGLGMFYPHAHLNGPCSSILVYISLQVAYADRQVGVFSPLTRLASETVRSIFYTAPSVPSEAQRLTRRICDEAKVWRCVLVLPDARPAPTSLAPTATLGEPRNRPGQVQQA